jgi:alanine racemase
MAVIKDDAYGHGAVPIARHLAPKVEWFCVARLPEALELRAAGIEHPILVFEVPPVGSEGVYKEQQITASISNFSVFERLVAGTNCHLHFDTGMFRLGLSPKDVSIVHEKMKQYAHLHYTGMYTHYANADRVEDASVMKQLEVFKALRGEFPEDFMTHTCNTGGIFYYHNKGALFDAVRPGVCLYGYAPGVDAIKDLTPILEWRSKLVQVKPVVPGNEVGYGSRWKATEKGWLGIIPVGYADGVFRGLSGLFEVEIAGKKYPQVGTISMDFMAVYLGQDKPDEGEEVVLLNSKDLTATEWAQKMGTIPYEITTAISPKVERRYF